MHRRGHTVLNINKNYRWAKTDFYKDPFFVELRIRIRSIFEEVGSESTQILEIRNRVRQNFEKFEYGSDPNIKKKWDPDPQGCMTEGLHVSNWRGSSGNLRYLWQMREQWVRISMWKQWKLLPNIHGSFCLHGLEHSFSQKGQVHCKRSWSYWSPHYATNIP